MNNMKIWEYTTTKIDVEKGFDATLKSKLNEKGSEGWELCGIRELEDQKGKKSITFILKREKE